MLRRAIDDANPQIAAAAIFDTQASAGSEIEQQQLARVLDPAAALEVRRAAAQVLRQRGGEIAESASTQVFRQPNDSSALFRAGRSQRSGHVVRVVQLPGPLPPPLQQHAVHRQ